MAALPHPLLPKLAAPADDLMQRSPPDDSELPHVLADAHRCFKAMKRCRDQAGAFILSGKATTAKVEYVAAALLLLCGYCRKHNGVSNPTAAARAFRVELNNPRQVTAWTARLEQLELDLQRKSAARAEWKRDQEARAQERSAASPLLPDAAAVARARKLLRQAYSEGRLGGVDVVDR